MTKEQFIEQMTVIEDYLAARHKADNVLNETFFKGSTPLELDFGDDLMNLAINQLSELSGVYPESIEEYIYEPNLRYIPPYGLEIGIKTSADLWDFEQHNPHKQ